MIEYILPVLPGLMTAGAVAATVSTVAKRRRLDAAWYRGVETRGRCLRTFVTTTTWRRGTHESTNRSMSHVYEFTTPDGRTQRFEETGSATVFDGDVVTVRYPQGRPDRATALPPGDRGAIAKFRLQLGFLIFGTLLCLVVTGVFFTVGRVMSGVTDEIGKHDPATFPTAPTTPAPAPPSHSVPTPPPFPSLPPLPSGPPDDFPKPPEGWPTGMP
ncbi:DUF3592 domain-containing protein [Streptomyces sp. NPDC049577]|uniref:DUF3592 domain-containing protein n=1 Tax=Streptomyces sp. NPDC049577 TaxID=3155153 RepID=UPI003424D2FC